MGEVIKMNDGVNMIDVDERLKELAKAYTNILIDVLKARHPDDKITTDQFMSTHLELTNRYVLLLCEVFDELEDEEG